MNRCIAFIFIFALAGCASTQKNVKISNDLSEKKVAVKKLGVIVPSFQVREICVGGRVEIDQELSKAARTSLESAAQKVLTENGFEVVLFDAESEAFGKARQFIDVLNISYSTVSVQNQVMCNFPDSKYPPAVKFPSVDFNAEIEGKKLDAVVLLSGYDNESSGGRKALLAATKIISFAAGGFHFGGGGSSYYNVLLLGKANKPLYFAFDESGGTNVVDKADVSKAINRLLKALL